MKRIASVWLSVMFLLTALPWGAVSVIAEENCIINGGFENGKDNWSFNSGTAEIVADAYEGNNAIQLTNPSAWAEAASQTVSVEPDSDYRIVWYSKRVSGTVAFYLISMNAADLTTLKTVSGRNWTNETSGNWVKNELVVNTGSATSVVLRIAAEGYGSGAIRLDEISMIKLKKPSFDGYITNGDFETGDTTGWDVYGGTAVSVASAHSGNYGLHLHGDGDWGSMAFQNIPVESGKTYTITMWLKVVANAVNILYRDGDGYGSLLDGQWVTATTWTPVVVTLTPITDTLCINVCGSGNGIAEEVYLDDVTMVEKTSDDPDAPVVPNIPTELINGDFENGEEGWTLNKSFAAIVDDAHGGTKALQMSNPSAWSEVAVQTIQAQPNSDYTITWYSKRVEGRGAFNFILMDGNRMNIHVDGRNWMNETSGNWVMNEVMVTTGADGIIKITLTSESFNAGILRIDDIVINPKEDEPIEPIEPIDPTANLVKNGDFSQGTASWNWNGNTRLDEENGYGSGAPSALLDYDQMYGEALTQTVRVEENTDYVITFSTKRISGRGAWVLILMDADTMDTDFVFIRPDSGQLWFNQSAEAGWVKTRLTFNSGDTTNIFFKFAPDSMGADVFLLDDVSMYRKEYEPKEPTVPGDANGDGKVNVRDLGMLQRYLNGWDVALPPDAMDVTGDGKLNVRDLGLLQRYLNGWDVNLYG